MQIFPSFLNFTPKISWYIGAKSPGRICKYFSYIFCAADFLPCRTHSSITRMYAIQRAALRSACGLQHKYTMEIILVTFTALTAVFSGYSALAPEYRNNSLYSFNVEKDGNIIVMNSQTGHLYRCDREFNCTDGLVLKPNLTQPASTQE